MTLDKASSKKARILTVGLSDVIRSSLKDALGKLEEVSCPFEMGALMEMLIPAPHILLCGEPPEGVSLFEAAQLLRMQYQDAEIYLAIASERGYDRKTLLKNGFSDVFFLPVETSLMVAKIDESVAKSRQEKLYRPVRVVDLAPGAVLGFDTYIYMPANSKYIKYTSEGEPLEAERVEKLSRHNFRTLYIDEHDASKFHEHTADQLRKIGSSDLLSRTEREEKLQHSVRELVAGLFSAAATSTKVGKTVMQDCQMIIKKYVTAGDGGKWYDRLLAVCGTSGNSIYARATGVSTYAALFAIGLGMENVDDIAMAAILQDVGLSRVPSEVINTPEDEWTPAQRNLYQAHPEHSVAIMKERKLVVPGIVYTIILQHHEHYNGTGYPKGLSGKRLSREAQILGIADRFFDIMSVKPGRPHISPVDAIMQLHAMQANNPADEHFASDLLSSILSLLPQTLR